jgi:hypothetical protein
MKLIQLVSLVFLVAACSSGGRQNIAGRQCPANWAPIPATAAENQKLWKKGDNQELPPGTYNYQRADLVYTEKGDKGAIVQIEDVPTKAGVFQTHVSCVRNARSLAAKNISVATNIVSNIVAKAGAAADVQAKEISFRFNDGRLVAESKAVDKPASLEKVYEGKAQDFYMLPLINNNVDYEVRSVFEDNTGKYVVSVKFKRVN